MNDPRCTGPHSDARDCPVHDPRTHTSLKSLPIELMEPTGRVLTVTPIGRCPATDGGLQCARPVGHGGAHDCGWTFGEEREEGEARALRYFEEARRAERVYRGYCIHDGHDGFYATKNPFGDVLLGPCETMSTLKNAIDTRIG